MSVVPGGVSVVLEPWITRMPHINSTLVTSWVTAAAGNQRAAATQWFTGSVSRLAAQGRQAGRQAGWAQTGCAASRGCWRPQRHPHKHPVATWPHACVAESCTMHDLVYCHWQTLGISTKTQFPPMRILTQNNTKQSCIYSDWHQFSFAEDIEHTMLPGKLWYDRGVIKLQNLSSMLIVLT